MGKKKNKDVELIYKKKDDVIIEDKGLYYLLDDLNEIKFENMQQIKVLRVIRK